MTMANVWVIRRTKDGMYYQDENLPGDKWASSLVTAHRWFDGRACSEACDPGEELVELDDAGQPVGAKAVRRSWVIRRKNGTLNLDCRYTGEDPPQRVLVGSETWVEVDANDEPVAPAPAIAQPSPCSDSADQPIPYAVTDPVDALEELVAERERVNVRLARLSRKAMRLDEQIDSAKARLRGGK